MAELKNIYYFYGPEIYLANKALEEVKTKALGGADSGFNDMNFSSYSAKGIDIEKVLMEANTLPAFASYRLIVITGATSLGLAEQKLMTAYLSNPSPSTVIVLVTDEAKVNKTSKFFKAVENAGEARMFKQLYGANLNKIATDELKKFNKTIKPDGLRVLLEMAGGRLSEIVAELEKLSLFVGDKDVIERSDVEASGMIVKEENIFELADAVGDKNLKRAVMIYDGLKGGSGLGLLGAFSRQFRILLRIKEAQKNGRDVAAVLNKFRVFHSFHQNYIRRARGFTFKDYERIFKSISDTALKLKISSVPDDVTMTLFIMGLCAAKK